VSLVVDGCYHLATRSVKRMAGDPTAAAESTCRAVDSASGPVPPFVVAVGERPRMADAAGSTHCALVGRASSAVQGSTSVRFGQADAAMQQISAMKMLARPQLRLGTGSAAATGIAMDLETAAARTARLQADVVLVSACSNLDIP